MRKRQTFDRRFNFGVAEAHGGLFPGARSRPAIGSALGMGWGLIGLADYFTGPDLWFGPLYLLCIGGAAWLLGRSPAVAFGLATWVLNVALNGVSLYPYGTIAALWNLAMRVATVVMFIGLLDHIRRSYVREWRLARTDPLTGALNRQAFFELAAISSRSGSWIVLAYADLDGLKRVNDQRGHAAGDTCLIAFVAHVRAIIRKHDHLARLGGDEFIVHMQVRDEAAAQMVAARLHREMNGVAQAADTQLRCSLGVLILPPGERSLDRAVLAADQLMYEAKQHGAGLVVATLREVRGEQFLVQRATTHPGSGANPVVTDHLVALAARRLDSAA